MALTLAALSGAMLLPMGLPPLTVPAPSPALLGALLVPALLTSVIGFVESISVAQTLAAILLTLVFGVEVGVSTGVLLSISLHLYKTSRPHVAEVGLVPGTERFRNVQRHGVLTDPTLLTLRVDDSLFFANARFLEDLIQRRVAADEAIRNVVLMCSAVNEIDFSALESLEAINERLAEAAGIGFHLSEVKGPVMDRLQRTHLLERLNGEVFLSRYEAMRRLAPATKDSLMRIYD